MNVGMAHNGVAKSGDKCSMSSEFWEEKKNKKKERGEEETREREKVRSL